MNKFILLLMWKNWLVQTRHKMQTFIEIILPIVFVGILVYLRSLTDPVTITEDTSYEALNVPELPTIVQNSSDNKNFWQIRQDRSKLVLYTPDDVGPQTIMEKYDKAYNTTSKAVSSFQEMDNYCAENDCFFCVALYHFVRNRYSILQPYKLVFRFPSESYKFPSQPLLYNWMTNLLYPLYPITGAVRELNDSTGGYPPGYYMESYLTSQRFFLHNIMDNFFYGFYPATYKKLSNEFILQRFPVAAHTQDAFLSKLEMALSFAILFSYISISMNTVKLITLEKEKQLTNIMRIMGIDYWIHWLAWFIRSMVLLTIVNCLVILLLLKISWFPSSEVSVLTHSSTTVLCAFFTIYSMAITTYCFMMSVFFSKANSAMFMTGAVWLMSYFPFMVTQGSFYEMGFLYKLLICLFQNSAMGLHFKMLIIHEGTTEGLQWHNIFKPVTSRDDFTIGCAWIMMVVDSLLYLIIALYVQKLMPNDADNREQRLSFIFKTILMKKFVDIDDKESVESESQKNDDIKKSEPGNQNVGIEIRNLRKIYDNNVVAVDGLTMNVYEDQITILLGYKGAGKTTTISMLAGMLRPTSGTAIINGKDLRTEFNKTRGSLGLCPQHNILFNELTVREHFIFFGKLKGLNNSQIREDVRKYINLFELEMNIDTPLSSLTADVKRKLSVALALCGESKVVLCDEPTIGLDPSNRQIVWDVLQQEKQCRSILLATHVIEEADYLGDRIEIMSAGKIKCGGTPFVLKKMFGVGYHLNCIKTENCKTNAVTKFLKKYIPSSKVESNIGNELSYELSESFINIYPKMLLSLEDHQRALGISTFGLSYTTLEDVYNNVSNVMPQEVCHCNDSISELTTIEQCSYKIPKFLLPNHLMAMFLKKIFYTLRNWVLCGLQILIPFTFILLAFINAHLFLSGTRLPPLPMTLQSYKKSITIIRMNNSANDDENLLYQGIITNINQMPSYVNYETTTEDLNKYMLKLQKNNYFKAKEQYLIGISIGKDKHDVYFNNEAYHATSLAVNFFYDCLVKVKHKGITGYIQPVNYPLPYKDQTRVIMFEDGNSFGFTLALNVGFAMSFVGAIYILFYIKERESHAKLLQFISGINVLTYWITAFLWDLGTFAITCLVIAGTLLILQDDGLSSWTQVGFCFVLSFTFGWAILPLNYLASMLFKIPLFGFACMVLINIITGVTFFLTTYILTVENNDTNIVADILTDIGIYSPNYLLIQGFYRINLIGGYDHICNDACRRVKSNCTFEYLCNIKHKTYCCDLDLLKWSEPGILSNIFYLFIIGLILFTILIIKEFLLLGGAINTNKYYGKPKKINCFMDSDILAEKNKVAKIVDDKNFSNYTLVVDKLTKKYKLTAVNSISVALKESECFRILGLKGDGKTTLLKMLIGGVKMTRGNAWLNGMSLKTAKNHKIYQAIGYCPQIDPLIEDLTGRETLNIYCLLRGAPRGKVNDITTHLAFHLNFLEHIDKQIAEYSADTKRKLSITLALIGFPSLIILDEPTTGMDLKTKRNFWNIIDTVRSMGSTVLVATNCLNDCEASCTKIAVMAKSEFRCIGSAQYLIDKFAPGYTLIIKPFNTLQRGAACTAGSNNWSIKKYMQSYFVEAMLMTELQGFLTYFIPDNIKWSIRFATMEVAKSKVQIEDYVIIQNTLEQLCQSFTS